MAFHRTCSFLFFFKLFFGSISALSLETVFHSVSRFVYESSLTPVRIPVYGFWSRFFDFNSPLQSSFFFLLICVRTKVKKQINLFGSFLCLLNLYAHSKRNLDNIIFVKIKKIKIPKFLNIDEERRLQLSQAFLSPRNDQEFKDFLRY